MPWKTLRHSIYFALGLVLFVCAGPALAVDGVIEINQARAAAGGVTASDTAGFPVTIDAPGSYLLTSNLDLPDAATGAISIVADNVTINLNGFSILGTCVCSATWGGGFVTGVTCTPTAAGGFGIDAMSQNQITVFGGTIRGVGGTAVLTQTGFVHDLQVIQNDGRGVDCGGESIIRNVTAKLNASTGITSSAGIIESCVASQNDGNGISASGGTVVHSKATYNVTRGIYSGLGANVINCTATSNGADGINGSGKSLFTGNQIRDNGGYGISNDSFESGYSGNMILNNAGGTVSVTLMIETGANICNGNTTCP